MDSVKEREQVEYAAASTRGPVNHGDKYWAFLDGQVLHDRPMDRPAFHESGRQSPATATLGRRRGRHRGRWRSNARPRLAGPASGGVSRNLRRRASGCDRPCVRYPHACHATTTWSDLERTNGSRSTRRVTSIFGVTQTPNAVLRGLRLHRGWTQEQVAALARKYLRRATGKAWAISADYVSKLERGEIDWPRAEYRDALSAVYDTDQLGFVSPRTRRDAEEVAATERRTFLAAPAVALLPVALDAPAASADVRLGARDVVEFEKKISSLAALQRLAGGGATRVLCTPEMLRAVAVGKGATMTGATRIAWNRGIARLGATAGWAEFDDGREPQALELLELGHQAAAAAEDPVLTAFLAEVGARLHVQRRRLAEALAELRRANGFIPPGIAATTAALAARASALSGDARSMIREVGVADDAFSRMDRDTSVLTSYANNGKHAADVADAFYDLALRTRRPDPELQVRLRTALDLLPADRARTRAVAAAKLAGVLYRFERDREQGDHFALLARGSGAGVQSSRMRLVLREMEADRAMLA